MVRKLLIVAAAITGFAGAANAGDTPTLLGSINLNPDQVLTSSDMSKVVGTNAAVATAGAAGATSGNYASSSQSTYANVGPYYYYYPAANASGYSSVYVGNY